MPINLSSVFSTVDTILNDTLSKYQGLRLIGFDQTDENKPYYLTDVITKGFYYKTKKTPVTGEVVEKLRIVPQDEDFENALQKAVMLELVEDDGSFVRFSFDTEKAPCPPNYEWVFLITPNKQDNSLIT